MSLSDLTNPCHSSNSNTGIGDAFIRSMVDFLPKLANYYRRAAEDN